MTRLLATLILLLTFFPSPIAAQAQADLFHETLRIGRGAVLNAQWHPNGNLILVDTVTGAWLYTNSLTDVAHLPDARLARFSQDGTLIAGIDAANNLTLWDSTTFTQTASYSGSTAYVIALEWSPDGTQIATLDRTGRILVWDIAAGNIRFEARLNGADQIAWSKGGSYLAAMNTDNGTVSVWEKSGGFVLSLNPSYYRYLYAASIMWRDDVQLLRWFGEENAVTEVWDVATKALVAQPQAGAAGDMEYSPDGTALAIASYRSHIEAAENGTLIVALPPDNNVTTVTSWSPDSRHVAFGTWSPDVTVDSNVIIMDTSSGEIIRQLNQSFHSMKGIYWSVDSQGILIVDGANRLSVTPLSDSVSYTGNSAVHMDIGATADWSSDGTKIAVADTYWGSRVWDAESGAEIAPLINIGHPSSKVVWQPDGTFLGLKSGDWWWQSMDHNVYIWDLANPQIDGNPVMIIPNVDFVADIAWSPDGRTLAIAERSQFVRFWSTSSPDVIQLIDLRAISNTPYMDYTQTISGVGWSPDSTILDFSFSSSGNGGNVWLLDVPGKKMLGGGSPNFDSDWEWTQDNQLIWARWGRYGDGSGPTSRTRTYDLEIGIGYDGDDQISWWEGYTTLSDLLQPANNAVLSPQASKVIGFDVADNAIIWDLEPQSLRVRLYGVNDAVWSPDETMLVTYGVDGLLRVIDSTSGETLHTFDDHFNPAYIGSPDRLKVFWSPDSRKIALLDRGALYIYEAAA